MFTINATMLEHKSYELSIRLTKNKVDYIVERYSDGIGDSGSFDYFDHLPDAYKHFCEYSGFKTTPEAESD